MDTQGDIRLGMTTWTCIVALGHAYVDMRGMTANMATSWTVSWGLRFYDQPSGGTTRRDWIRWTSSSPFATVSDCVVWVLIAFLSLVCLQAYHIVFTVFVVMLFHVFRPPLMVMLLLYIGRLVG